MGFIAGSGGGLTDSDLGALIGAPPHRLDPVLRGMPGRSLQTRVTEHSSDAEADPAIRAYLFAHETLRVTAEEQLGNDLICYREKIHDWIGSYAGQGWPGTTPSYAIRGYTRLLTATSDVGRLTALARDPGRQGFLLQATGNDYATLTEIKNAQQLIATQRLPDLQALVELAVCRYGLSVRNRSIPSEVPATWALLGRFDHAEAVVRSINALDNRDQALFQLAGATAVAGKPERAEPIARAITDPREKALALTDLAAGAAKAGNLNRASALATEAEAVARTIDSLLERAGRYSPT